MKSARTAAWSMCRPLSSRGLGIVWTNTPDGEMRGPNLNERTFGYTRAQAVGQALSELIIPHSLRDAHGRGIARYLETGEDSRAQQACRGSRFTC